LMIQACPMCSKWKDEPGLRIAELEMCYVLLNRDQFFTGYTFVVTKKHVTELFHLEKKERQMVIEEVNGVAAALYNLYGADKINYELLGNMSPHMHWHIIPRFRSDALWPRPVWSEQHPERDLTESEYAARTAHIRDHLRIYGEQTEWII
jgi:diadenosine tetraphosphate (Ap4A) HIT family hydrolase